jgi:hypothetical protein
MSYKGRFLPQNPQKYAGDANNIIWRSTWEKRVMEWLDRSDNVVYWASEELVIKYYSPIDNKIHRYFPDFTVKIKKKDGTVMTHVLEVKPEYQTKQPVMKRKTKQQKTMERLDQLMVLMASNKTYKQYLKARDKYLAELEVK